MIEISTRTDRLDIALIHGFLSRESYWARGIAMESVVRSIEHALPFGAYDEQGQCGFARVVTDRTTFAWLCDVFVLPRARGRGVAKALLEAILAHPDLQGLRRIMLATADAHGLYARYGFAASADPARYMERRGQGGVASGRDAGVSAQAVGGDQR